MSHAHILLADDERAITDYLAPILERAGFTVTVARDEETALQQIGKLRPDLVVLDVIMPALDGRQVCRQLRACGNWTPVIMLTQVNTTPDKVLSLEEGADDYLCKPFGPQELIARIRAVLRRRQAAPQRKPLSMSTRLRAGEVLLDRRACRAEREGQVLDLTPKAVALLEYLALPLGKVAYIAGGDVWMKGLKTSRQARLTRDGRNSHPRWSADCSCSCTVGT